MRTDERRLAAANQLRRVNRELALAEEIAARPKCSNCRFGPVRATDPDKCEHFAHWHISQDKRLSIPVTTAQARSEDGLCGPEGELFQPYSWWRKGAKWAQARDPVALVMIPLIVVGTVLGAIFS